MSDDVPALPARADVVVIGGGIVGTSSAWDLARAGHSVVLCEKGRIAGEQSSRNWGYVRQQGRDPAEIPLIVESVRIWKGLNAALGAETGYRQTGVYYLAGERKSERRFEEFLPHAERHQLGTRMLSSKEVAAAVPGAKRKWLAGMITPTDGRAEPSLAAPAIARGAAALGVHVAEGCAVRGLETSAGRVSAVITERGPVACDAVLLAGGAWSRIFLHSLGITFPQLTVRGSVQRIAPLEAGIEGGMWTSGFAIRKRLDGGYNVAHGNRAVADLTPDHFRFLPKFLSALATQGDKFKIRIGRRFMDLARLPRRWPLDRPSPFEAARVLDPEPHRGILDTALSNLKATLPAFEAAKVVERWAGYIDVTPDAVPVIAPVPALAGLFLASGFSGHGFGIGPGAGRLAADLVRGANPIVDPAPFRFDRF